MKGKLFTDFYLYMRDLYDIIIIGAGACGLFTAINIAEKDLKKRILILEKGKEALTKVRISGGGRCNLTNALADLREFVKNYPRGNRELLGVFNRYHPMVLRSQSSSQGRSRKTHISSIQFL